MTKVAILGAGQIGRAVYQILMDLRGEEPVTNRYSDIEAFVVDSDESNIFKLTYGSHYKFDLESEGVEALAQIFKDKKVTHVINALPFFLNEKAAAATVAAGCSYIDFTEDDIMADKVQALFQGTGLDCAVKCGLAPGFINYVGYDLVSKIDKTDSLMISVGALPRTVSYDPAHPELSYNLTWSVDGLVNEYIRPCRVKRNGEVMEIPPLGNGVEVVIDGIRYEAAYTSGGVGSLIRDLDNVPNIHYMTLRYPGHYKYVKSVVQENHGNFAKIRDIFQAKFPRTDDDVIVVYANAIGRDNNDKLIRLSLIHI